MKKFGSFSQKEVPKNESNDEDLAASREVSEVLHDVTQYVDLESTFNNESVTPIVVENTPIDTMVIENQQDTHMDQSNLNPEKKEIVAKTKDYLKYKSLKLKEYLGQLTQEDFNYLLEVDFQEQLKDTPPLNGLFSPHEELQKIKTLPKEQRHEALTTFKENLARQREGLAAMRVFIERSIKFNNDVPSEKLMELIKKFSEQYGFDVWQEGPAMMLVDSYYEERQKVLEMRGKFPDNLELVRELTGVEFAENEKIDVSVGPLSVDIYTDKANLVRLWENLTKKAEDVDGFKSTSKDNIAYTVVRREEQPKLSRLFNKINTKEQKILDHEHEHVKNHHIQTMVTSDYLPSDIAYAYTTEPDPEIKKVILEDYLIKYQNYALKNARDEITAKLQNNTPTELQENLNLLFFSNNDSSYDYSSEVRNRTEFKDDSLYQETVERILTKEYRDIIQKAVNSYVNLVEAGNFSVQEATALLTDQPLKKWSKTARRVLEQKIGTDKTKDLFVNIEKPTLLLEARSTINHTITKGLGNSIELHTLYSLLVDKKIPNKPRWKNRDEVNIEKVKVALDQLKAVEIYSNPPPLPTLDTDT